MGLEMNGLGVLDPAGASRSFDKSGNGYGRGEGISVVVLKRLSDAIADGDSKSRFYPLNPSPLLNRIRPMSHHCSVLF